MNGEDKYFICNNCNINNDYVIKIINKLFEKYGDFGLVIFENDYLIIINFKQIIFDKEKINYHKLYYDNIINGVICVKNESFIGIL